MCISISIDDKDKIRTIGHPIQDTRTLRRLIIAGYTHRHRIKCTRRLDRTVGEKKKCTKRKPKPQTRVRRSLFKDELCMAAV